MNMNRNGTGEGLAVLGCPGFRNAGRRSMMRGDGDGSTIPPHIEAAFRKEYDELVEAWVASGARQEMAQSMANDMLAANMKHWKRAGSQGLVNDNDDINEWRVADGTWAFRELMDFTRRFLLRWSSIVRYVGLPWIDRFRFSPAFVRRS